MSSKFNKKRTEVFTKFSDKQNVVQYTLKTKMCEFIQKKKKCPYGSKCHYAHKEEELRKSPCWFKDTCKKKNCPYDHSDNIVLPEVPPPVVKKPPIEPFIIVFSDSESDDEDVVKKTKRSDEEILFSKEYEEIRRCLFQEYILDCCKYPFMLKNLKDNPLLCKIFEEEKSQDFNKSDYIKDVENIEPSTCETFLERDANRDSPVPFKKFRNDFKQEEKSKIYKKKCKKNKNTNVVNNITISINSLNINYKDDDIKDSSNPKQFQNILNGQDLITLLKELNLSK